MNRPLRTLATPLVALALLATACGGEGDEPADDATETLTSTANESATVGATASAASCEPGSLPTNEEGVLTVATGEPVFEPWMVDDTPENGEGFESALVYRVAEELGFSEDQVTWIRTGFDEAIGPGSKDFDFNVQQYSITEERDEVVDFSDGYYEVEQALVASPDSDVASAATLSDLQDARLGAAIGTTSLDYIETEIQPSSDAQVYDDNAAAKAAFDAGQVDGLVFDLPTAYYITAVEIPDASIVGVLPRSDGEPEELGFLFEDGSELVDCVNQALGTLRDEGVIDELEDEWLNQGGSIPTLER